MSDTNLRTYKSADAMEPIVLLDYFVKIITYAKPAGDFRKVQFFERIPFFQAIDLGAIAANGTSAKLPIGNLDLWDEEFGQWRWFPLDNAQISLFLPSGVSKWQLKNITVSMDKSVILRDPQLVSTEFCTWEDQRPSMQAMNFSDYALTACRIIVTGYRYHCTAVSGTELVKLQTGALPFTPIVCTGFGGAGK